MQLFCFSTAYKPNDKREQNGTEQKLLIQKVSWSWHILWLAERISLGQKKRPKRNTSLIWHALAMTGHNLASNHVERQVSDVLSLPKRLYCRFFENRSWSSPFPTHAMRSKGSLVRIGHLKKKSRWLFTTVGSDQKDDISIQEARNLFYVQQLERYIDDGKDMFYL